MNIRAIWKDPDYTYGKQELVNIVQFEWLNGRPAAWVITNQGVILHRYTNELTVIDKEYMS